MIGVIHLLGAYGGLVLLVPRRVVPVVLGPVLKTLGHRRDEHRPRVVPPDPRATDFTQHLADLPASALARAWADTDRDLRTTHSTRRWMVLAEARRLILDEVERRDPERLRRVAGHPAPGAGRPAPARPALPRGRLTRLVRSRQIADGQIADVSPGAPAQPPCGTTASHPSSSCTRAARACARAPRRARRTRCAAAREPAPAEQHAVGVGVDREVRRLHDLRPHGHVATVHLQVPSALEELVARGCPRPGTPSAPRVAGSPTWWARWCTTRPPVAMPEAETMMLGVRRVVQAAGLGRVRNGVEVQALEGIQQGHGVAAQLGRGAPDRPAVDIEGRQRHRAVDVDRHPRDLSEVGEPQQLQQHQLGPVHRERGHQQRPAPAPPVRRTAPANTLGSGAGCRRSP